MTNKVLVDYAEEFAEIPSERERLEAIIELGEEMEKADLKTCVSIPGCVSKVWMCVEKDEENGTLTISGWAEALIVRGYVALVCKAFSGKTCAEISSSDEDVENFVRDSKLPISTIPSRNNTFAKIYNWLKNFCEEK